MRSTQYFTLSVLALFVFIAIAAFAADPAKPTGANAGQPKPSPPNTPPTNPTNVKKETPQPSNANTQNTAQPKPPAPNTANTPKPAETPKTVQTPKPAETPKTVQTPKPAETPKTVQTPKPAETPKTVQTPKPAETPKTVQTPKPAETPKTVETPKATETSSKIKAAKVKPAHREPAERRCSAKVTEYLRYTVTRQSALLERETSSRARLNELRSALVEEQDKRQSTNTETKKRIATAWTEHQTAINLLEQFEEETLKLYGDVPKICIDEVDTLREYDRPNGTMESYMRMLEQLALHGRLYARTARGVFDYILDEYAPMLSKFHEISSSYRERASVMLRDTEKQSPSFSEADFAAKAQLVLRYAEAGSLAAVPYAVAGTAALVAIFFAPFVLSAVVVPNLLWRVWAKLFILHHLYGTTTDGVMAALRNFVELAGNQNWPEMKERAFDAILSLAGTHAGFYNGIFAVLMMFVSLWILLLMIIIWIRGPLLLCCRGRRRVRSSGAEKKRPKNNESSSTADKQSKKKA